MFCIFSMFSAFFMFSQFTQYSAIGVGRMEQFVSITQLSLLALSVTRYLGKKKHLEDHMSNTHAENQRFSCDFKTGESACSYHSTTKSNLRAHKKRVHEKTIDAIPPKHACGLCGYRTNSKFSLRRHREKCNKSLNQNPIDHICNICSKKFSTKKILTKHRRQKKRFMLRVTNQSN